MNIFVTGAAGFIGSSFARMSIELGHRTTVFDVLTYAGNLENLAPVSKHANFRFVKGDICDSDAVVKALEELRPDAVVNFAAESHVDRSIMDASPFVRTNVGGVQTLLDALRKTALKSRFLQVSTDEVYGSADDGKPFTETNHLKPSSPYAASKTCGDLIALSYHHTFGMDIVITRCSNNYGPYQFPEKLIPLFTTNLMEGRKVPVYGDGQNIRDWIHCDDHSRGVFAALERGKAGQVYNFGGGNPTANLDLTRHLIRLTGRDDSAIEYVKDRAGHDRAYLIDYAKAERELGWRPLVNFDEGLAQTVAWYKQHRAWWDAIKSGAYRHYYEQQYVKR